MTRSSFSTAPLIAPARGRRDAPIRWALLALAALSGGCAENPHRARTSEYYRDAQLCRAQNPLRSPTGTGAAKASALAPATGIDTENYLRCLDRLGYQQDAKTDPLLKALAVCREAAGGAAQDGMEMSGSDRATFQACLRKRGVEGEGRTGP